MASRLPPLHSPTTAVIVTGAASGIGQACALALAEVGRPVACWDLDRDGAVETAATAQATHGVASMAAGVDVTATDTIAEAAHQVTLVLGGVGGLVHAAGIVGAAFVDDVDEDTWDRVQSVNVRALAFLTQALLPHFRQTGAGSALVAVSSIEGLVGSGFTPAYSTSKAAVLGLTRSIADRMATFGGRANAVCPGLVDTPMLAPVKEMGDILDRLVERVPLGRVAGPAEIARVVRFLLSDEASYVTGQHLVVDGGMLATT